MHEGQLVKEIGTTAWKSRITWMKNLQTMFKMLKGMKDGI